MSRIDPDTIARWRSLGLTDAEIGRRLGLSGQALREQLDADPRPVGPDDNRPNDAETR